MKFEKISIRNFRNFENIEIAISNKNIFFGLNDIGKTNFLYAMRYVFDKDIRKNGFLDSDFHKINVETPRKLFLFNHIQMIVLQIKEPYTPKTRKLLMIFAQIVEFSFL